MDEPREKMISLIKYLAIIADEIVFDMKINDLEFNSIEWRKKDDLIILHKFIDEFDFEINYDELSDSLKDEIYLFLVRRFLN